MSKQEREKRAQLMRLAIPAAMSLIAVVGVVLGTRVWQQGLAQPPAQAMDLRGQWLGMRLTATDSPSAADLGVPPEVRGVVVSDVQANSRALQAGLAAGDVVARVDGTTVTSLVDMYTLTTKVDAARPLQVDFLRAGRPMTVIVPPPDGMVPPGAPPPTAARPLPGANSMRMP
jgi:S1-C subfamily serine protease